MVDKELLHFISFELGGEVFGLPLTKAQEIIRMVPVLKIPQSPDFVEGIINLRGKVVPVIDLKKRFSLEQTAWGSNARIIIAAIGRVLVGLMVDQVYEVVQIEENAFEEAPAIVSAVHHRFIRGIVKRESSMTIILDADNLVSTEEVEMLKIINSHKHA